MSAQAPFTAYIKVVPSRGRSTGTGAVRRGGRGDYVRDLQRLAGFVYDELKAHNGGLLTLAEPGGGEARLIYQYSDYAPGTSARPQMGQNPSLLMITGFFTVTGGDPSDQPVTKTTRIHANEIVSDYQGEQPWLGPAGLAVASVQSEVKELKNLIETCIVSVSDASGNPLRVFRLTYKGIVYGDRGHHFPAP